MTGLRALTVARRKTIEESLETTEEEGFRLKRELSALDVLVLGVGVIIGAGIFVLTGVAAATEAGPAIMLSFVLAGVVCALAALCYAEFASMVPVAGSAYTYSYATLGELVAFIIGWDLVLEFTVGAAAVAVGWSGYLNATLDQIFGITLPEADPVRPSEGGADQPVRRSCSCLAVALTCSCAASAVSAKANIVMVVITLARAAHRHRGRRRGGRPATGTPFIPVRRRAGRSAARRWCSSPTSGSTSSRPRPRRRATRSATCRSASWARSAIVTVLYIAVSAVDHRDGVYDELEHGGAGRRRVRARGPAVGGRGSSHRRARGAHQHDPDPAARAVARDFFAMARDRLLPPALAADAPALRTPARVTIITGVLAAILAGVTPIATARRAGQHRHAVRVHARLRSASHTCAATDPDAPRPFRCPRVPVVPILGRRRQLADDVPDRGDLVRLRDLDGRRPGHLLPLLAQAQRGRTASGRPGGGRPSRNGRGRRAPAQPAHTPASASR